MFKSKQEIIVIQAEAIDPITTGIVFWSHDKGTAKMLFKLRKDGTSQSLAEGTIVPVLLKFNSETAEDGIGRHIYHAVIEDAVNGIVSIVLENNILGYQGRVDGSIYIELPDSRSLDTAGRFTFHIKRSPIDEDVPELEDYFWQGFGEIMEQYHESIAEIKSEAKVLLDSLTADVTTAKTKVTQLEQSITTANTNLNARIDEINKKIDDNDVFTKAESSANVVAQIIGKENVTFTVTLDLKNKVAKSIVENQNSAYTFYGSTALMMPGTGFEVPQTAYDQISTLDSSSFSLTRTAVNEPAQMLIKWNILEIAKKSLGEKYFKINGATDKASQIELLRAKLSEISGSCIGFGSGPGGNKLNLSSWRKIDNSWQYRTAHSNAVDTRISNTIVAASVFAYIDDDGFYHNLVYAETCDGVTPSKISVNYVSAQFKLNISVNEQIELMIAANHVENLATPEEAKAGTNTTKTMTPLRVNEAIENKAVSIAGNQTVGGIKNFKDGVLLDDVPVFGITRNVVFDDAGVGGYFNAADKFSLGTVGKIDKVVLVWSRVDDSAGTLLNYSWSQTVLFPDDIILGNSYRVQLTSENYKFITFKNESGILTISGSNENSVAPNRIYRIKRIVAYIKK